MGESTRRVPLALMMCMLVLPLIMAVDMNKFRACKDTDFCKRNRELQPAPSLYHVVAGSVRSTRDLITADILNTYNNVLFEMELTAHPERILRLKINEKSPIKPRYPFYYYYYHFCNKDGTVEVSDCGDHEVLFIMWCCGFVMTV